MKAITQVRYAFGFTGIGALLFMPSIWGLGVVLIIISLVVGYMEHEEASQQ